MHRHPIFQVYIVDSLEDRRRQTTKYHHRVPFICIFTLFNVKHGESIVIGLAASSTSKGPQVKTTEPMTQLKSQIVVFN